MKPVSAATSPTNSRSSTPHNFDDDDDDDSEEENNELRRIHSRTNSEKSFTQYFPRSKNSEADLLGDKLKILNTQ